MPSEPRAGPVTTSRELVPAVIPVLGRHDEVRRLLDRLGEIRERGEGLGRVLLIDNGSGDGALDATGLPGWAELIPMGFNAGGSGGFNAGLRRVVDAPAVWLLDSDALPEHGCLAALRETLNARPNAVAVGAAITDGDGAIHELGGMIDRRTGRLGPAWPRSSKPLPGLPVQCDYAASCCVLVRGEDLRVGGLMPEAFLNGDDAEWLVRLASRRAGAVLADPRARCAHPRFDRPPTPGARYCASRNAFGAIDAVRAGSITRLRRGLIETARAVRRASERDGNGARAHIAGLWDAARGRRERDPFARFGGASRANALLCAASGGIASVLLALKRPRPAYRPDAPTVPIAPASCALSIVVLTHGDPRRGGELTAALVPKLIEGYHDRELIVVINDAGRKRGYAARHSPEPEVSRSPVRFIELDRNTGIAGFNRGVEQARGAAVLILDDDATPDGDVLDRALATLDADPSLAAITLHPRHPKTRLSEWPFAVMADSGERAWPVMGCANLVRREDWLASGGYDEAMFVYRNDTDLALRLLGMGRGVSFNPDWVVWHDSAAAARKPVGWFHGATRNWVWMCRRHGRRGTGVVGSLLGWAWAHRLAGARPAAHLAAIRGMLSGMLGAVPRARADGDGAPFRRLLALKCSRARPAPER
ncbi:MAG: glycosyltransferase [Planctomycetota bacterium]